MCLQAANEGSPEEAGSGLFRPYIPFLFADRVTNMECMLAKMNESLSQMARGIPISTEVLSEAEAQRLRLVQQQRAEQETAVHREELELTVEYLPVVPKHRVSIATLCLLQHCSG